MRARASRRDVLAVVGVALALGMGCGDDDDDRDTRDGDTSGDVTRVDGDGGEGDGLDGDVATTADGDAATSDGDATGDADGRDGETEVTLSFTDFVIELLEAENQDSASPVPYASFSTLADNPMPNVFDGVFD